MSSTKPLRFMAFVDGYNLYHYINDSPELKQFKWLNLRSLCEKFLPPNADLYRVLYFSAYAHWDLAKEDRHRLYVKALNTVGVEEFLGRFKDETGIIRIKKGLSISYTHKKEKQTDVSLASELVLAAKNNEFDKAFLITSDSDFVPAIKIVQDKCVPKKIWLLRSNRKTTELQQSVDKYFKIRKGNLRDSQLSQQIKLKSGAIIHKPPSW